MLPRKLAHITVRWYPPACSGGAKLVNQPSATAGTKGLRLLAKDDEDLALIAACLQDALVPLSEMRYEPGEGRFYMIVNRFLWERAMGPRMSEAGADGKIAGDATFGDSGEPLGDGRRNAGMRVDHVVAVRIRGIDRDQTGKFLSLLTVQRDGTQLNLIFAGGGVVQLEIGELALLLHDLGAAWPTQWRPDHGALPGDGV